MAIAVGVIVYFDHSTGPVSKTAGGNTKVGVAVTAAADLSGTVRVRLNGRFQGPATDDRHPKLSLP